MNSNQNVHVSKDLQFKSAQQERHNINTRRIIRQNIIILLTEMYCKINSMSHSFMWSIYTQ